MEAIHPNADVWFGAFLGVLFLFLLFKGIAWISRTRTFQKWGLKVHVNNLTQPYVPMTKMTGQHSREYILDYMRKEGIMQMKIGGTIVNYQVEVKKDRPAPDRVYDVLIAMEYRPSHAKGVINKGLLELGRKARFDELLNFCLNN